MTCFIEFLAKRDPHMFLEMVSRVNEVLNEAERAAKDPLWRQIARKAAPWVAGATAAITGANASGATKDYGQANQPVDDGKPQVTNVDDNVAAYNPATGKFQMTPKSKAIMSQGRWEIKGAGGVVDPLKNFADEGDSDASGKMLQSYKDEPVKKIDNTAKYAKLLYDIKKGTLDPEEFKNSPDYKTAKAIAEKGSPASSPVVDWDAAANLVQAVKKLAPDTDSGTGTQYKYNTPQSNAQGDKWVQAFKNVGQAQSDTEQQIKDIKAAQESGQKSHDAFMAKWKADNERQKALFGERPAEQEQAKVTDGSDVNFPTPVLPKLSGSGVGKVLKQNNQEFDAVKAKFQDMGKQFKSNPKSYDPKNPDWQKFRAYNPNLFGDDYRASQNQVQKYIDAQNFRGMMQDALRGGK